MNSKRPHPSDGPFSEPFRPRAPPDIPARNDAVDNVHEVLANQRERRKWLEDVRYSLRQDIADYARHAGQLCNLVENRGKTVGSIPKDKIRPFVRALRQLVSGAWLLKRENSCITSPRDKGPVWQ